MSKRIVEVCMQLPGLEGAYYTCEILQSTPDKSYCLIVGDPDNERFWTENRFIRPLRSVDQPPPEHVWVVGNDAEVLLRVDDDPTQPAGWWPGRIVQIAPTVERVRVQWPDPQYPDSWVPLNRLRLPSL